MQFDSDRDFETKGQNTGKPNLLRYSEVVRILKYNQQYRHLAREFLSENRFDPISPSFVCLLSCRTTLKTVTEGVRRHVRPVSCSGCAARSHCSNIQPQ